MNALTPALYRVRDRRRENPETVTLDLEPVREALPRYRPGQFSMVYAFGVGEVPVSVSGIGPGPGRLSHTVRAVGKVTEALCAARIGDMLGLRGPYGRDWSLGAGTAAAALGASPDEDLLVIAGGVGLAPLRPVVLAALDDPGRHGRLTVLAGARSPRELIHRQDLDRWHALVSVDAPDGGWTGPVGLVTSLLDRAPFRPGHTTAFVCGPEPMMRATAEALLARGVPADRVRVSLERNMRCATAWCGHCQLGPVLLCRDGPVLTWEQAVGLLAVPEL